MKRLLIAIVLLASLTVISSTATAAPLARYRYYPRYRVATGVYVYPSYTYAYPVTTYPIPVYGNYGYRGYGPNTVYVPPVVNARVFRYGPYFPY